MYNIQLRITATDFGIKLISDQIDNPLGDMCFSNTMIIHSVY